MTDLAQSDRRLRVAVVGGGIGGLAAACSLRRRGIDVSVFEQAAALGEIGAGLTVFPNSLRQLERMGLREALSAVGAKISIGSCICRSDGTVVAPMETTDSSGWNGIYGMHRADLLTVLASNLPPDTVRTGFRCIGFEQNDTTARLHFANGETAEADVVIAADGIQSVLQKFVVTPQPPEYSGVRAYRGLVPRSALPDWPEAVHLFWMGHGKHFMVYPVRGGQLLNYVGFVPTSNETAESWSAVGDRDELAASFAGWNPHITSVLEKVENCFWWGLYDRRPLDTWTNGRLVLLGDAAHAMLPHLGQGANQSIEDGVALAVLLAGHHASEVPQLLPQFEAFRRVRTDIIQAEARKNGLRYDSKYESLEQRDREVRDARIFRRSLFDYDVEQAALAHWSRSLT